MASYNARIDLEVRIKKALANVDKLEKRIGELGKLPINIEKNINKEVKSAIDSFQRLGRIVKSTGNVIKGLGGAGALGGIALALKNIARVDIGALGQALGAINKLDNALLELAFSAPGATAALAALTAGTLAFAPQISRAAVDTLRLGKALGRAKGPLKALIDTAVVSPMAFAFGDLTKAVEAYKRELFETSETVSELSRRQKALEDNLDRFNSGSETAEKIAQKLVNVNARLNDELREQADLLRRVSGVTVTELEAAKGRKSIETRKRAERFRADQAAKAEKLRLQQIEEELELKKALGQLEDASIQRANARLDLQAKLTAELNRTRDAAKFRAKQPVQPLALPAFQERGLQLLDDSVRLNESQLRIERALNGQRARGVRFLEKQTQEEKRQLDLGLIGPRSNPVTRSVVDTTDGNLLTPGAASLVEQQAQAVAAAQATERLVVAQRLQRTTSGVRTELNLQLATAIKLQPAIAAITEEFERQLAIQKQGALLAGKFSPIGGTEDTPGSPAFLEARRRRRRDALSSGLIGGAFPLLFGQGPGAAIGGAIGGGAGGLAGGQFGFGLSLVGTQFGVLFDQLVQGATTLGQALSTLTADIDAVIAATGKTNTVFAQNIKALEEAGLKNTALALATQELANVVGDSGVSALKEFGSDTQRLGEVFARVMTQMQADLARLVNASGALAFVADRLEDKQLFQLAKTSTDPRVVKAREEFNRARFGVSATAARQVEPLRQKLIQAQREVVQEEAKNTQNLSKLALQEKENLDRAKLNLQNAERALQAPNIVDKFTNQLKEQQKAQLDFETRRNSIVENYEKSIATLRRNVENQISNLRLQNLKKANQLEDQRAANALANLRNQQAASRLFTAGPLGQDPAIAQLEQNLQNAADTYSLKILEAEQKRAKLERDAALSVQEIDFRTDRFKLDVARQAAELSLNTQKQIDRINKNIVDRNAKFEAEKYRNERNIANLKLKVLKAQTYFELQQLVDQQQTATDEQNKSLVEQINFLKQLNTDIDSYIQALGLIQPPPALTEVQGITQAAIDLSGYNEVVQESIGLQNQLNQSRLASISGELEAAGLASLKPASDALLQIESQVLGSLVARNLELEKTARITELTRELGSKALAEEIAGIEFATKAQRTKIQTIERFVLAQKAAKEAEIQAKLEAGEATDKEIAQLGRIKELLEQIGVLRGSVDVASAVLKTEAKGEIGQFIEQATDQLNNIQAVAVSVSQGIGDAIGNSLTDGVARLTEGTATAQEVFADFLKNVAQLLLKTAAQMIATYVAIGVARKFAGLFGKDSSGSSGLNIEGIQQYVNEFNAGDFTNAFSGQANGGPVKSGTPYIIGERGPELFVPRSNGRIVPNGRFGGGGGGDVNVVVNVDAKGSNAQGSDRDAKALGSAIGIAVRSELVKQKRPGGLLAS